MIVAVSDNMFWLFKTAVVSFGIVLLVLIAALND